MHSVIEMPLLRKHTVISCPACLTPQGRLTTNVFRDQILTEDMIDGRGIMDWRNGMQPNCRRCRAPWFSNGRLHTEYGWLP